PWPATAPAGAGRWPGTAIPGTGAARGERRRAGGTRPPRAHPPPGSPAPPPWHVSRRRGGGRPSSAEEHPVRARGEHGHVEQHQEIDRLEPPVDRRRAAHLATVTEIDLEQWRQLDALSTLGPRRLTTIEIRQHRQPEIGMDGAALAEQGESTVAVALVLAGERAAAEEIAQTVMGHVEGEPAPEQIEHLPPPV